MNFNVNIPTKIISGANCVTEHKGELIRGKKAFIVTGKSGAKKSGALDDVTAVLSDSLLSFCTFDKVEENPSSEVCFEGGKLCASVGCDFIIAIGGGSVIDAAKAIAAHAANPSERHEQIFDTKIISAPSLPIVAIPTTAGTGSEGNYYSVLTVNGGSQKQTFKSDYSWPVCAFLDPKYTCSLPYKYTVSCALDAFAHAIESYNSPKSDIISESLALYAAKNILDVISKEQSEFSYADREKLIYASCAAGIAISITGTGFPHPLGYSLTLLDGIPHGAACAVFERDYIDANMRTPDGRERLGKFFELVGYSREQVSALTAKLANCALSLSEDEIKRHVDLVKHAGNFANSSYVISYDEMLEIYRSHFAK